MSINTQFNFINQNDVTFFAQTLKNTNSNTSLTKEQEATAERIVYTTQDMQKILNLVVVENGKTTYKIPKDTEVKRDETARKVTTVADLLQAIELYNSTLTKHQEYQAGRRITLSKLSEEPKSASSPLRKVIGAIAAIAFVIWFRS